MNERKYYIYVFGFALTIGAWVYFLLSQYEKLKYYKWEISIYGLACALIIASVYYLLLATNWAFLLKNLVDVENFDNFNLDRAIYVWLTTIMSRYIPGNVWHILGRMAFSEKIFAKKIDIVSSSIIEQALTIVGMLIAVALSFPAWPIEFALKDYLGDRWILLIPSIVIFFIIIHPRVLNLIIFYIGKRIKNFNIKLEFDYQKTIYVLISYVFVAIVNSFILVAIIGGMGELKGNEIFFIIGSSALAWVIGYLSFITPSGLGVREGALTALLAMIYPMPIAIVASLLFRIICTVGELLAIVMFSAYMKIKYRKNTIKNL